MMSESDLFGDIRYRFMKSGTASESPRALHQKPSISQILVTDGDLTIFLPLPLMVGLYDGRLVRPARVRSGTILLNPVPTRWK